jgi:hypothetical protein
MPSARSGTLLGPEGMDLRIIAGTSLSPHETPDGFDRTAFRHGRTDCASYRTRSGKPGSVAGDEFAVGIARTLRTAQWTRASFLFCSQANKGARWMPWHQEPKKDVGGCDKPRGAVNRAVIRGFPNGETRQESCPVTLA